MAQTTSGLRRPLDHASDLLLNLFLGWLLIEFRGIRYFYLLIDERVQSGFARELHPARIAKQGEKGDTLRNVVLGDWIVIDDDHHTLCFSQRQRGENQHGKRRQDNCNM